MTDPAAEQHNAKPLPPARQAAPVVAPPESQTVTRRSVGHGGVYSHFRQLSATSDGQEPPPERFSPLFRRADYAHPVNESQKGRVLNDLQRQFGNRYVQRVLAPVTAGESGAPLAKPLQRQTAPGVTDPAGTTATESLIERSRGQPLDSGTRQSMEPRFGRDFSGVRVPTGSSAQRAARHPGAQDFTTGRDLYFSTGAYHPASEQGHVAALQSAQNAAVTAGGTVRLQPALKVSSPQDAAEKEAEATAQKIVRMVVPESSVADVRTGGGGGFRQLKKEEKEEDKKLQAKLESPNIARRTASEVPNRRQEDTLQRKMEGQPEVAANVAADIQSSATAGTPLPSGVRRFMEPRFRANFSQVRIQTGERPAQLNQQVNARAFTVGNQIFFGRDQFQPERQEGRELIAHELTHTIQQGAAVQRSEEVNVTQQAPVQVQRLGISDALDYFADKANLIPGFRMFTIVLGVNPINMSGVDRNAANILRALIEFLPGGALITQALENSGVFDKVGTWVEQQIQSLGLVGSDFKQAISQFLDSLSWTDFLHPDSVWERAKSIFTEPIDRIISFAGGLGTGIIQFIKDAILIPLAKLAEGTPGWDLLCAVLGKNPITGDPVPCNAETLIGGFMKLIGQEDVWDKLKEANAVARALAWFQGAMTGLMGFVDQIPTLAVNAFNSLELVDIVLVSRAFAKVAAVFVNFIGDFISWGLNTVWNLLEIIFDVVSPGALSYIKRTGPALNSILKNPLPFVGNLVEAAKLGFQNFANNFGAHLKAGLIDWLTGSLSGVYIPKALTLAELGKFALSILGITWAQIRRKIVKALGPNGEKIMQGLETGFDIVVALVKGGPAAAWELIKEKLTDLKDTVIGGIVGFVTETIVEKAIPKLIALFIPGAGFISAIISIYDTVMVFVQKIAKIIQVVTAFIDSIVTIAAGNIGAAAERVESILGGLLSLAISFLAGFLGLGKITDKIKEVIEKVRATVDKAIDAAIAWIVSKAKKLGIKDETANRQRKLDQAMDAAVAAMARFSNKPVGGLVLRPILSGIRIRYGLKSLTPVPKGRYWAVEGEINPWKKKETPALREVEVAAPVTAKPEDEEFIPPSFTENPKTVIGHLTKKGLEAILPSYLPDLTQQNCVMKKWPDFVNATTSYQTFPNLIPAALGETIAKESIEYVKARNAAVSPPKKEEKDAISALFRGDTRTGEQIVEAKGLHGWGGSMSLDHARSWVENVWYKMDSGKQGDWLQTWKAETSSRTEAMPFLATGWESQKPGTEYRITVPFEIPKSRIFPKVSFNATDVKDASIICITGRGEVIFLTGIPLKYIDL